MQDDINTRKRNGIQELEKLKGMVNSWKDNYSRIAEESGWGDFLCGDFQEEIDEYIVPYLRRLVQTQHLIESQVNEFLVFCSKLIKDLCDRTREEA